MTMSELGECTAGNKAQQEKRLMKLSVFREDGEASVVGQELISKFA